MIQSIVTINPIEIATETMVCKGGINVVNWLCQTQMKIQIEKLPLDWAMDYSFSRLIGCLTDFSL